MEDDDNPFNSDFEKVALLTHMRAMNQTIIQIEGHYSEMYASKMLREAVRS